MKGFHDLTPLVLAELFSLSFLVRRTPFFFDAEWESTNVRLGLLAASQWDDLVESGESCNSVCRGYTHPEFETGTSARGYVSAEHAWDREVVVFMETKISGGDDVVVNIGSGAPLTYRVFHPAGLAYISVIPVTLALMFIIYAIVDETKDTWYGVPWSERNPCISGTEYLAKRLNKKVYTAFVVCMALAFASILIPFGSITDEDGDGKVIVGAGQNVVAYTTSTLNLGYALEWTSNVPVLAGWMRAEFTDTWLTGNNSRCDNNPASAEWCFGHPGVYQSGLPEEPVDSWSGRGNLAAAQFDLTGDENFSSAGNQLVLHFRNLNSESAVVEFSGSVGLKPPRSFGGFCLYLGIGYCIFAFLTLFIPGWRQITKTQEQIEGEMNNGLGKDWVGEVNPNPGDDGLFNDNAENEKAGFLAPSGGDMRRRSRSRSRDGRDRQSRSRSRDGRRSRDRRGSHDSRKRSRSRDRRDSRDSKDKSSDYKYQIDESQFTSTKSSKSKGSRKRGKKKSVRRKRSTSRKRQ